MAKASTFRTTSILGLLISAAAVYFIAVISVPEDSRSEFFWYRLVWTEVLLLMIWSSFYLYFRATVDPLDHLKRMGGIAPTICIVVISYSVLSFISMMLHAFVNETNTGNRIHWIAQIVFLSGAALTVLSLYKAKVGASAGLNYGSSTPSPSQLHDMLASCEASLTTKCKDESISELTRGIKRLRESVKYSLNDSSSLANSQEYHLVCAGITELCQSMSSYSDASPNISVDDLISNTSSLLNQVKLASKNRIRR